MLTGLYQRLRYQLLAPLPVDRKTDKPIKDRVRKFRYILFGHLPFLGRKRSYGETHKANARRVREGFFDTYCRGRGLDVGYGGDPITPNAVGWDFEHGDAQLLRGLADADFDFVYSSHLLEHLPDCHLALKNWWRVLRPGGYLILYVPHRDLYEKKTQLPSRFNDDHKHFFLPDRDDPPDTLGLLPLLQLVAPSARVVYCRTCDDRYVDPGPTVESTGEFSIELVAQKPH